MQIVNLILENFTTICLSMGLGVILITDRNFDKKTNRSFAAFIFAVLGLIAAGIMDGMCAELAKPNFFRYLASSLGYVLRPASVAILINILLRRKKTGFTLWIPIAAVAAISFTSPFTHLMFWFDDRNAFMRGPLAYISHIISAAYLVVLLFLTFERHKNITSAETFAVLFSSAICVLSTVLETVLSDYHFLITGAMAVSCALYYLVLYVETYKVDPLTGLLNRKSLYLNFNRMKNRQFSVISADLNCLKEINDSCGHSAGDAALRNLADVLAENGRRDYCPYRVGGDEFVLIGKETDDKQLDEFIATLRAELKKKNIMASFGYAIYHPGDGLDDICNLADAQMYIDKKNFKSRAEIGERKPKYRQNGKNNCN